MNRTCIVAQIYVLGSTFQTLASLLALSCQMRRERERAMQMLDSKTHSFVAIGINTRLVPRCV